MDGTGKYSFLSEREESLKSVESGLPYSSVLNTSHVATIWNFDPNYSLPNVTQVSLPKMFQIVATWLVFSKEEYAKEHENPSTDSW